ncbi:MAG: S-layer homology domain-containing protein, partial [Lachnospiraceae bacterium]|nr:S-layer homology domain-containing protein [Lachnospiraceae bacterium]
WAKESMEWAVTQGIISGKGDASSLRLAPQGNATRAECAMMLMKLLKSK